MPRPSNRNSATMDDGSSQNSHRQLGLDAHTFPDGGYGWIIVMSCFTLNCFTWGVTSSYGVYLSRYLSLELFPGATSLDFGFVGGFNFAFAMISAPLATYLSHFLGRRYVMLVGSVLQSVGLVSASSASEAWQLYITQGALVGIGIGFLFVPSLPVLSQWFLNKRSVANGISSAGSGVGGVAFSWGTDAMIRRMGIPWALRTTGLITLFANVLATLLVREQGAETRPSKLILDIRLLQRCEVCLLLLWAFISMFGYITLLFSLADFSRSIGLSSSQATDVTGTLNLGTAVGRPLIGIISDRFRRIDTAAALTLLCGAICFAMWIPAASYSVTMVFAFFCGAILGVFWITIGPLCGEVGRLCELDSLLSLSWMAIIIPTTFAEPIALRLRQPTTSAEYLHPQIFAGGAYLVAGGILLGLRFFMRRKIRQ